MLPSIKMYNYSINTTTIIITTILIIGVNLISISFSSANAQNSDFRLEKIQHMMGHRPHMMGPGPHHNMMANRMQQMQPNSPNSFSTINGNNNTTIDNKNIFYVSIVLGAASFTTNAYQPNPAYIKEGQKIIWTNNDNNIHTVTQRDYSSSSGNNYQGDTTPIGFNSGILNIGQSFAHLFYKEGKYDYYCAIHPWMIGQVIVSTNSSSTAAINNNNNNETSMSLSPTSSSMSMSMMERGNIAMGFNQNKITHNFKSSPTGGEIIITALHNNDTETIKQIKNHILDIQREFSQGNFTKPFFIHAQQVPGTKIMSEKKNLIKYSILDMKNGSTLILTTSDKQLIDAIGQFMNFQATAHGGH